MVQSPLVSTDRCSRVVPCVGCMCPPVVVALRLLQMRWCVGLAPRPAERTNRDYFGYAGVQGWSPGVGAALEGRQCQLRPSAGWGRARAALEEQGGWVGWGWSSGECWDGVHGVS